MRPASERAAVEVGTLGQGGKGVREVGLGVAMEVSFADEPGETGEDGEGDSLAVGEESIGSGPPNLRRAGFGEIIHHDVKCGEEGVLESSMRSRFLSLRDQVASRL